MDKKDWGIKRVCLSCGTRFYDLNKSPIICPSCGAVYDTEYLSKRKSKILSEKIDDDMIPDDDIISDNSDSDIVDLEDDEDSIMVSLDDETKQ